MPPKPRLRARLLLVTFLSSTAGCGVAEELYTARVNELARLKVRMDAEQKAAAAAQEQCRSHAAASEQRLNELEADNKTLTDRLSALGQNVKDLQSSNQSLSADLERARKAQVVAETRARQFHELFARFKSMIDAGKLKVEVRGGLMLVKLADNILFDPGKTDLKPEGKDALKEVAGILAGIKDRKFQVAGHTDNTPVSHHSQYKDNWGLSTARAVEVVKFMIDEGGMPPDRLSAAGFADQMPVAGNDTEEGRRQNRRIEIVLLPNIEDLPPMDGLTTDGAQASAQPAPPAAAPAPMPAPDASLPSLPTPAAAPQSPPAELPRLPPAQAN